EVSELARAVKRELPRVVAACEPAGRARDELDWPCDAAGEDGCKRRGDDAAERTRGKERDPEWFALRLHGACRSQQHNDVAATRFRGIEVPPAVDRDSSRRQFGEQQARLFGRQDREPLVLRLEEPSERAGRRVDVLAREQCDLAPQAVEGGVLERAADK